MRTKVNENSFAGQSIFVGIDTHKKSWKVTVLSERQEHKSMSQDPDPVILSNYLKRNFPGATYYAVYEAGFSGFKACRLLTDLGVNCMVTHAADVPTNEKERLQKTDKVDSRKLARSLRNGELKPIHVPDPGLEADRALVRQRFRITKDLSRIKNRVKSLLMQFGIELPEQFTASQTRHWSKLYTTWLENLCLEQPNLKLVIDNYVRTGEILRKELLTITGQVRDVSRSDRYSSNYNLLMSVPGIGLVAAMTILVQLGDIRRFNTLDELCNYIGLVPKMHSSGDRQYIGEMITRGRKEIKIMLIEASWIAVRRDPALMAKFDVLSKTMKKNKAIIRIARKLLSRIRYVLLNRKEYESGVVK